MYLGLVWYLIELSVIKKDGAGAGAERNIYGSGTLLKTKIFIYL
jgi:hypothetical protein